ncbi:MAG TPA: extracellular solute-binding protein, partial [Urbifossiella sp.]|nr:extracellular solute-binding protein [Urbifossiella sp.]
MVRSWAARTGATVELVDSPMSPGDATDVAILPSAELSGWADRGDLVPVPTAFKEAGHPLQWSGLLAAYRSEPYAGWGAQLYGLPVATPGFILVYRSDRFADKTAGDEFRAKFGRPLAPPTTWEDLAETAAFFAARDKAPCLPPLPTDPGRLADLFFRVAAGFDRPAYREGGKAAEGLKTDALSFAFRTDDGKPRLDQPGFTAAGRWLADLKTQGVLPPTAAADPVTLLKDGKAVLAVLSLEEAAQLRPPGGVVDPRLGVAPVPGTRGYATADGKVVSVAANYVPYLAGGWVGVVRSRAASPAAGF